MLIPCLMRIICYSFLFPCIINLQEATTRGVKSRSAREYLRYVWELNTLPADSLVPAHVPHKVLQFIITVL